MLVKVLNVSMNMSLYASVRNWIQEIPDHVKTKEMCKEAMGISPDSFIFFPTTLRPKENVLKP